MLFCIPETNKIFKKRKRKSLPNTQIGTTVLTVFHSGLKQTKKKASHIPTHTQKRKYKKIPCYSAHFSIPQILFPKITTVLLYAEVLYA